MRLKSYVVKSSKIIDKIFICKPTIRPTSSRHKVPDFLAIQVITV